MNVTVHQNKRKVNYSGVDTKIDGKLVIIQLNVPKRKNALTAAMYAEITNILKEVSNNPNISVVAITGTGDFYSSGNDFGAVLGKTSSSEPTTDEPSSEAKNGVNLVK